ncbi:COX15/CtaA family protein [Rothia sp. CCM 9419]|uniref:COX15/CtaA family protein n=1 Tax=Rothia sp. CCM 9419 TaxID=3402662 RepID=UPI003AEE5EC7
MSSLIARIREVKAHFISVCLPYTPNLYVLKMAYAVVIANIVLIVSGGIVRLTGSGLGCDTWPKCTSSGSWTTTPEMGIHGLVEFGNRMLTFVLIIVTGLTFLSILRIALPEATSLSQWWKKLFTGLSHSQHQYSDLFNLSLLLLWGIPVQAVVGGLSVLLKLNPWMVTAHYMLSAIMIALGACYLNRVRRYFESGVLECEGMTDEDVPQGVALLKYLGWVSVMLVCFLIFMGTVTTGTGPHAGDPSAHRHAFNPWVVTRMHSFSVWAYLMVILSSLYLARKHQWSQALRRSWYWVLAVVVYQGIVGYIQFFNGLPVWLVEMHLLGSALFTWAAISAAERQLVIASQSSRQLAQERTVI